jgi:hypothetical protein
MIESHRKAELYKNKLHELLMRRTPVIPFYLSVHHTKGRWYFISDEIHASGEISVVLGVGATIDASYQMAEKNIHRKLGEDL